MLSKSFGPKPMNFVVSAHFVKIVTIEFKKVLGANNWTYYAKAFSEFFTQFTLERHK